MVWTDWLTARRVLAIALVQVAVLGLVGGAVFAHYIGFSGASEPDRGYFEIHNYGEQSVNVTVTLTDVRTDTQLIEARLTLRGDGREGYYGFRWPPMSPGKKRLTVVTDEHRNSYEFTIDEDGIGPNLVSTIASDGIQFGQESGGM